MKIISTLLLIGLATTSYAATIAYDPTGNTTAGFNRYTGSVGLVFKANNNITVTELGITTDSPGNTLDSTQLFTQLYRLDNPGVDNTSTLLGSVNFTSGQTAVISNIAPYAWDTYMQAPTGGSINLIAGETYVISSYGFGGSPNRAYINKPDSVSVGAEITHLGSRYGAAAALPTTPDGTGGIGYAGPTFNYIVVPEPSAMVLFGLGGFAMILRRRK